MTEPVNHYADTEQAEGFPEGVTVELVNTLHEAAKNPQGDRANACKAALALNLLKEHGIADSNRALNVIMGMGANGEEA